MSLRTRVTSYIHVCTCEYIYTYISSINAGYMGVQDAVGPQSLKQFMRMAFDLHVGQQIRREDLWELGRPLASTISSTPEVVAHGLSILLLNLMSSSRCGALSNGVCMLVNTLASGLTRLMLSTPQRLCPVRCWTCDASTSQILLLCCSEMMNLIS